MKILRACTVGLLIIATGDIDAADRTDRVRSLSYSVAPVYTRLRAEARYFTPGASAVYSIDGLTLDLVAVFTAMEGGPLGTKLRDDLPMTFRSSMSPAEIATLHDALVTQPGAVFASFKVGAIEPATLAGVPGFRYQFQLLRKDGLQLSGIAYGAVVSDRLYLITYAAPAYYFEKNLPMAEGMAKSAKLGRARRGAAKPEPQEEQKSEGERD